jgi:catechol 2,3-dioxygenase-like lactoylglutathione lyase family enzyme
MKRRFLRGLLASLLLTAGASAQAEAVVSVGLTVSDLERSTAFFTDDLAFEVVGEVVERQGEQHEALESVFGLHTLARTRRLGDETVELVQALAPEGRPIPLDSRSNDRWFQHVAIIVGDMDLAYARLREARVRFASSAPQRLPDWNPNAGGIEAFYFKDPDGHVLEVLEFPAGKGDPKWHRLALETERLFLGIDHTAIVVADTEQSLAFWRDALGLGVVGTSENWGSEQEHLNSVFGAHLRITTLRAKAGPGVELLEYLSPTDGRPFPPDARANDLVHWETRVAVGDLHALASRLREERARFVSPTVITLPAGRALQVRDPDGHAVELHGTATCAAAGTARR